MPRTRPVLAAVAVAALALPLAACSSGGGTQHAAGYPEPASGKSAAFALDSLDGATANDLAGTVGGGGGAKLATDRSGNIYVLAELGGKLLRVSAAGHVTRFSRVQVSVPTGIAAADGGGLLIGAADGGLTAVDAHGRVRTVETGHAFRRPVPLGLRPDGATVVLDGTGLWTVKGRSAHRFATAPAGSASGVVDAAGTTYLDGDTLARTTAVSTDGAVRRLAARGTESGTGMKPTELASLALAPARNGFWARALKDPGKGDAKTSYLVHVEPSGKTTVAAKGPIEKKPSGCRTGKQYPALNSPCTLPWFVAQSGSRVIALGGLTPDNTGLPGLAVHVSG